ncbi:MAG: CHAT domain-containing protein [Anaerolineae bacterium]
MTRKILVLAANPKNTEPLRLDKEVREIENGLQRAQKRGDFDLQQRWALRPADMRRAMLDYRPNIVHFCGHGASESGIILEDHIGNAQPVASQALAGFFKLFSESIECVVLNACYSETQARAIAKHIQYVIGMSKEFGDEAAIEFAVAFYDALGAGESIEFAYELARNAIAWGDESEQLTPILIKREEEAPANQETATLPTVPRPTNLSFEEAEISQGNMPRGWFNSWGYVDRVSILYDIQAVPRPSGTGTCLLLQKMKSSEDEFGSVMQRCPVGSLVGKMIRLEAEVMTKNVQEWAGLWLRADEANGMMVYFDNMSDRPIHGTTSWQKYEIIATLPPESIWLNYGIVLAGSGTMWADNFKVMAWSEKGYWVDV